MSYRIEFAYAAWRIPAADAGTTADQFVTANLGGDNNLITPTGAVARRWSAVCIGTAQDVIRQACRLAKSCEGQSLQMPGRKSITPEAYIAKFRRLVANAPHISEQYNGNWFSKQFKISEPVERIEEMRKTHPEAIAALYACGEPTNRRCPYSEKDLLEWKFSTDPDQMRQFFAILPAFLGKGFAWNFCQISGPGEK